MFNNKNNEIFASQNIIFNNFNSNSLFFKEVIEIFENNFDNHIYNKFLFSKFMYYYHSKWIEWK